ncbi:hypothetical protein MBLNU457_g2641t1 [Dothideomycetes sp. NU457]
MAPPALPFRHPGVPDWRLREVRSYFLDDVEIDARENAIVEEQFRALLQRIRRRGRDVPPTPILTPGSSIARIWCRNTRPAEWLVVQDTAGNMVRWRDFDQRPAGNRHAVSVFEHIFDRQRTVVMPQLVAHDKVLGVRRGMFHLHARQATVRVYCQTTWEPVIHCVYHQQAMDFFTPEEWEFTRAWLEENSLDSAVDMASAHSIDSMGERTTHY